MKNQDMPAMPIFNDDAKPCVVRDPETGNIDRASGLTKREQVVKDFMCALISSNDITTVVDQVSDDYAILAGDLADAYFREVEK